MSAALTETFDVLMLECPCGRRGREVWQRPDYKGPALVHLVVLSGWCPDCRESRLQDHARGQALAAMIDPEIV